MSQFLSTVFTSAQETFYEFVPSAFGEARDCNYLHSIQLFLLAVSHSRKSFFFCYLPPFCSLANFSFVRHNFSSEIERNPRWLRRILASRNYANCFCALKKRRRELFYSGKSQATTLKVQPVETGKKFCTLGKRFAHKVAARLKFGMKFSSLVVYIVLAL